MDPNIAGTPDDIAELIQQSETEKQSEVGSGDAQTQSKEANQIYDCKKCNKHLMGKEFLDRHTKVFHSAKAKIWKGEKRVTFYGDASKCELWCKVCDKKFKTKKEMAKHSMEKHKKEAKFRCDNCNNMLNLAGWNYHQSIHPHPSVL